MGGNAFTSGPEALRTPRMNPSTYFVQRDHYLVLLRFLYHDVGTPIEGPSKTSFGDLDFLVSNPISEEPSKDAIATYLHAARRTTGPNPTTSYAVPCPNSPSNFVQIDIHPCSTKSYKWQLFHQSHGDLWNLLGTTIRPFGLTANPAGLHLRVPEIDVVDKKKSLLVLTLEPDVVIRFLGLDAEKYNKPFGSVHEMYEYVTGSRFFRMDLYKKKGLKANDRKRLAQRQVYRDFVDDWLPAKYTSEMDDGKEVVTRESILEEALEKFGKREAFDAQLAEWKKGREGILEKQGRRQKRKAEAVETIGYADAWMRWLNHDGPHKGPRLECDGVHEGSELELDGPREALALESDGLLEGSASNRT